MSYVPNDNVIYELRVTLEGPRPLAPTEVEFLEPIQHDIESILSYRAASIDLEWFMVDSKQLKP